MPHTNKTPNLELPQWLGTDKRKTADDNAAYLKIDTAIQAVQDDVTSTKEDITGINNALSVTDGNVSTIQGNIDSIINPNIAATYYVRADGNDENDGLTNTAGGAFATIQHAINILPKMLPHDVIIRCAAGTYDEVVTISGFFGNGSIGIIGNEVGNPVVTASYKIKQIQALRNQIRIGIIGFSITSTEADAITVDESWYAYLRFVLITASASKIGVNVTDSSNVYISTVEISNKSTAIKCADMSRVFSSIVMGSGNTTGLHALYGSEIIKNSTQPTATTGELAEYGGLIR
ncbi:MAG TPA: hypothetical protein VEF53_18950 [Patescibacteria group bacterium]|nr:hypothetical protein [Patescibacteria group bacterium]